MAQVGAELRDGLRLATRHRALRALMIFALVTSVGEGASASAPSQGEPALATADG
jgi:hypothetical protein